MNVYKRSNYIRIVAYTACVCLAQATISMDIALVKLSEPVKMSHHINVACLPSQDEHVPDGSFCVTAGWGHTVEG